MQAFLLTLSLLVLVAGPRYVHAQQAPASRTADLRQVAAASEPVRQWLNGSRDPASFAGPFRVFSSEAERLKGAAFQPESPEGKASRLYLSAMEALSDYAWLQDQDGRRRKMRRARELLGKEFKGTLDEVDLLPYGNLSAPAQGDETFERVGSLIRKYRLRTEERKFDSRDLKGVYAFLAEGWSGTILAAAASLLDQARQP